MSPLFRRDSNPALHYRQGKQSLLLLQPLPMLSSAPSVPPVQSRRRPGSPLSFPSVSSPWGSSLLSATKTCREQVSSWSAATLCSRRRNRSVGKSPHSNVPCSIWHTLAKQHRCRLDERSKALMY